MSEDGRLCGADRLPGVEPWQATIASLQQHTLVRHGVPDYQPSGQFLSGKGDLDAAFPFSSVIP
ncbi:hypothetical protein BOX37_18770 [Nocardia mangyaensis]|uniref:Uncharacterized protein n=1 Tax=Nocardia mangyaensis TaxID=2213200 RepID=A0A1J0VUC5_9NOCA|nr:hypothetical protein [Nocardia mangyaensis]APE35656.1 hypothetical protein BOX37_18770 [Nocardia mangyaensis]